jgi:WD40 repeat protein
VGFSGDLKLVAIGQPDGSVHLLNTSDGSPSMVLKCPFPIEVVTFSPDGKSVAGTGSTTKGKIAVWTSTGKGFGEPQILQIKGAEGFVSLAFNPDGKQLVSGGLGDADNYVQALLWDVESRKSQPLDGSLPSFSSVAWSRDGKQIVGGSILSANVLVWDAASGKLLNTLTPPAQK